MKQENFHKVKVSIHDTNQFSINLYDKNGYMFKETKHSIPNLEEVFSRLCSRLDNDKKDKLLEQLRISYKIFKSRVFTFVLN
jgi:flagellin-specific chaperone FliS